jgi:hypothetical protein
VKTGAAVTRLERVTARMDRADFPGAMFLDIFGGQAMRTLRGRHLNHAALSMVRSGDDTVQITGLTREL